MLYPLEKKVLSYFGVTSDIRETGYILSDGTMVDLSGRHEANGYVRRGDRFVPKRGPDYMAHQRLTDHRQLPESMKGGTEGMREFMAKTGAVRVLPGSGISVTAMPTVEAVAALIQGWSRFYTELLIDIMDPDGGTGDSRWFKPLDLERVMEFLESHFESRGHTLSGPTQTGPIELIEIPMDYSASEALEMALGKDVGATLYRQIVERVGKEPGPELGHGMKGVVYDLGDGRVLKLTADASELEAMTLMKQSDHPNLVRVEDVFVVCRGQSGVGVVVREWVGNVLLGRGKLRDDLVWALNLALDTIYEHREGRSNSEAIRDGMDDLLAYLEDVEGGSQEEQKIVRGIRAGISELRRLGVYGIDFHDKNIAIDDAGNAVIFDVGVVDLAVPVKLDQIGCMSGRPIVSFSSR
jgi:hypothetical protein